MSKKKVVEPEVQVNPYRAVLLECKNGVRDIDQIANDTVTLAASEWIASTLEHNMKRGKTQWWNTRLTSVEDLQSLLFDAMNQHRYQDVMTIAAMLEFRMQGQ